MAKAASFHTLIQEQSLGDQVDSHQEEAIIYAGEIIHDKPKKKWQSYIWDTLDKSPEERRFLFKLDAAIITFACLGECTQCFPTVKRG